jgi:hypothetical protein
MITNTLLFDVPPVGGGIAIFAGVAFFLVLAAVAFIAFTLLRKTLKMAFRLLIVAVIMVAAIAGSIALFMFGGVGSSRPVRPDRPRPTRSQ